MFNIVNLTYNSYEFRQIYSQGTEYYSGSL